MLPTMLQRGYEPRFAMGPIMGIGGVDMLIPPSALTVLLGSLAGISISGLLVGGIVPGLVLSAIFVGYITLRATINPALAPDEVLEAGPTGFARWALLGPGVELRRTAFDVEEAAARMRATDDPRGGAIADLLVAPPAREEVVDDAERRVFAD